MATLRYGRRRMAMLRNERGRMVTLRNKMEKRMATLILPERLIWVLSGNVITQLGDHFCVGVRFKSVAFVDQKGLNVLVIGDDSIMNNDKPEKKLFNEIKNHFLTS